MNLSQGESHGFSQERRPDICGRRRTLVRQIGEAIREDPAKSRIMRVLPPSRNANQHEKFIMDFKNLI
ncbi:predicted protein [Arabidopsis lyrata subsp. lyrata]|uniref:Predicted protein n=1 Tax=Arabidopsis lyrata subsp. lyrata TaxID=81972 RepID=D7MNS2_ARALL|nr:predicted protein [Arabidopsis lyrata subsp. lyrata]